MATFPWSSDVGTSSITAIEALARSSGITFTVTSTFRAGDPGYHGKSNAVDMASSTASMDRLAAYLYQYSPYLLELIHSSTAGPDNGGWFVKNGVRGYHYPADIVSQHYNHVHCATTMSALQAASSGKLAIPAGTVTAATTLKGCLPKAAASMIIMANTIGGALWMLH